MRMSSPRMQRVALSTLEPITAAKRNCFAILPRALSPSSLIPRRRNCCALDFMWRSGVVVRQCAVAEKPGTIPFYQFEAGSAFNTADCSWAGSMMDGSNHMQLRLPCPKEISVPACTIAGIKAEFRPIKYLKIDAEGFEEKII